MSTLKVNNLQNTSGGSSSTPEQIEQGRAKVWCLYNGANNSVLDSFNTSSATDGGTGAYIASFTNNLNNVNYSVQLTCSVDHGVDFFFATIGDASGSYTPPATTGYVSNNCGSGGSQADTDFLNGTVHGDLA